MTDPVQAAYDAEREAALKELADLGQAWDAAPGPAVKPLEWVKGFYETRDHDDVNKNWPYNLQAWRAEGYLIIYQGAPHGLYVLRTPTGENQVASHDLNIVKAAAQADYEALATIAPAASPLPFAQKGEP
jgi:hypothetical protein